MTYLQLENVRVPTTKRYVVIFDIDGCLVDSDTRLPVLLDGNRPGWNALHHTDTAYPAGRTIYTLLIHSPGIHCVFVTSRQESSRDYTLAQLEQLLGVARTDIHLLMRPIGEDATDDVVLKPRLIEEAGYILDEILLVIEDRDQTVEMWRSKGIECWQPRSSSLKPLAVNN